jgi:hypothetical protein
MSRRYGLLTIPSLCSPVIDPPNPGSGYYIDYASFFGNGPECFEHMSDDFDTPGLPADQNWPAQGQWTYPASASYIKTLLLLRQMTGDRGYLDRAKKLADMELEFLSRPAPASEPEWWRMPFRDGLLEALLLLHQEIKES